jgi:flavodoxin
MKTLIAYYSRTGKNESLAIELQKKLTLRLKAEQESKEAPPSVQVERVDDAKGRSGPMGFLTAGMDARLGKQTKIHTMGKKPEDYDMVILVSPLWSGVLPPAMRTYLSQNSEKMKKVAFLSVSGSGEGNKKALPDFEATAGRPPLANLLLSGKDLESGYAQKLEEFMAKLK